MTTLNPLFKQSVAHWSPHDYQRKAVKFLAERNAGALFLDPGLGKTSITLAAIKQLKAEGKISKVLLIAPLRVCVSVWPKEIEKWVDFNDLKCVVLHGPDKDAQLKQDADIYIVNPEGLEWLLKPKSACGQVRIDVQHWKGLGFDALVIDELTKFKHTTSKRFKYLKSVLKSFKYRWGLTGTPASNGLMDLFGQCYILDEGEALGKYITHYRMTYFNQSYNGFDWTLKPGADKLIFEKIKPLALRMAADDYLQLPALTNNYIRVELDAKTRKAYDQLENDLLTRIGDKIVTAATAASASIKCRQVANGGIYLDREVGEGIQSGKREFVNLHEVKSEALADLVEELQGSPLLVAYDFAHDLDRIRTRLKKVIGMDVPFIGGGVSAKRGAELAQEWNRGNLPVLLGHPQSIGHGLDLQESAHHVCWHSLTWDLDLYEQFIRRVLRQGNAAEKVFVHHIVANDTIDDVMLKALATKRVGQAVLFDALKDRLAQKLTLA
jgi:SNF2 family DNA or RNA helicase